MENSEQVQEGNLPGLLSDLWDICVHEIKKSIKLFWPKYCYISDELIISTLSMRVKLSKSVKHLKEVHEHYHQVALSNFAEVRGDFGIVVNQTKVYRLLAKYFPGQVPTNPSVSFDTAALLDPTVKSIMKRFGHNSGPTNATTKRIMLEKDFRSMIKVDTMKRIAEMHLQRILPKYQMDNGSPIINSVTLHVIIEKARHMPKVDLFRGADLFCVVFFEGSPDLFQTEIRSGLTENDWTWDADLSRDFKWVVAENSELLNVERNVVVMVYDKDQLSEDDLIGCVLVQLGELRNGHFNSWKRIIRPPDAPKREYLFFHAPVPELKLQVTLTVNPISSCKIQESAETALLTTVDSNGSPLYDEGRMQTIMQPSTQSDIVFLTSYQ